MKMKSMSLALVLAASVVGASSASASTWDPPGTSVTGTQIAGTGALTAGSSVTCGTGDVSLTASGDLATATGTSNPVRFGSCTGPLSTQATVTTLGTWTFTATSTTSVDATAVNPGGNVAVITIGEPTPICTITVPSPVHIAGNTWNNSTHRLTINSAATFPVVPEGSFCVGVTTTGTMHSTFQLPSNVVIT